MANEPYRGGEFEELTRAVRDLNRCVARLERLFNRDFEADDDPISSTQPRRSPIPISGRRETALESRIGSQWLNRIGVVAILFGVSFLLRYAFVSDWLSAAARLWLGVAAGVAFVLASEIFRARGYRVLSLSLKSAGAGIVYLSLWAGFEMYKVLSAAETFAALTFLTVVTAALALREYAEVLAILVLIGALLAPAAVSVPAGDGPLFLYLAILDVAAMAAALFRGWWKLFAVSFPGTVTLCAVWYHSHYTLSVITPTATAATFYFLLFALGTTRVEVQSATRVRSWAIFAVAVAVCYAWIMWLLLSIEHRDLLAAVDIGVAALYFVLAVRFQRRAVHGGFIAAYFLLGIAFVAVSLAIEIDFRWISLAWLIEAAVVMIVGFWQSREWLRWGALVLLALAILKAFIYDVWRLGLGYRTVSFIALGVLLLAMSFLYQRFGFSIVGKGTNGGARRNAG